MRRITWPLVVALIGAGLSPSVAPLKSQDHAADGRLAAKPGTIYFVEGGRLASIQPDGRKAFQFPRVLAQLGHFQPYTARVAPDGRQLAFGLGELRDGTGHPPSKMHVMDITKARGVELVVDMPGTAGSWTWRRGKPRRSNCRG